MVIVLWVNEYLGIFTVLVWIAEVLRKEISLNRTYKCPPPPPPPPPIGFYINTQTDIYSTVTVSLLTPPSPPPPFHI